MTAHTITFIPLLPHTNFFLIVRLTIISHSVYCGMLHFCQIIAGRNDQDLALSINLLSHFEFRRFLSKSLSLYTFGLYRGIYSESKLFQQIMHHHFAIHRQRNPRQITQLKPSYQINEEITLLQKLKHKLSSQWFVPRINSIMLIADLWPNVSA